MTNNHQTIEEAMVASGLPNQNIPADGKIHRFGKNNNCWAVNNGEHGAFGDWSSGLKETWSANGKKLTKGEKEKLDKEIAEAREKREAEEKEKHEKASQKAEKIWNDLTEDGQSEYLANKKISAYGIRFGDGHIAVPICDIEGKIWSIQEIFDVDNCPEYLKKQGRNKNFLKNGRKDGCFHLIGEIEKDKKLFVVEGYATGASIHMATQYPVVVAFDAGNILPVVKTIRQKYPVIEVIIAGDEDKWKFNENGTPKSNTGRLKAETAARQHDCKVVFPKFSEESEKEEPTDFNDLHVLEELGKVKEQLENPYPPSIDLDWEISRLAKLSPLEYDQERKDVAEKLSVRVNTLDESVDKERAKIYGATNQYEEGEEEKLTQKKQIIRIAKEAKELWSNHENEAGITVKVDNHYENYLLKNSDFKTWISHEYYKRFKDAPSNQAYSEAKNAIESMCIYDGKEHKTFNRVGERDSKIYVDLANDKWEVIEISKDGWNIINGSPVKFIRNKNMLPYCRPETGGDVNKLKKFINYGTEDNFRLIIGFILNSLNPKGPYPILNVLAEQDSGKTILCEIIVSLIDPVAAPLRTRPKTEQDLLVSAKHNHLLCFDNLSGLSNAMSDAFCRLATGGGLGARKLYTDDEESVISVCRPTIMNGINDIATRPDLLDRSIIINLTPLEEKDRKDPNVLKEEFEKEKPAILGALCDALVGVLNNIDNVVLNKKPRMLGFARLATAAEKVLGWEKGSFLSAYTRNIEEASSLSLEMSPIGSAIMSLIDKEEKFDGTATELLSELKKYTDDNTKTSQFWPKLPNKLSRDLKRLAPQLRREGIDVEICRTNKGSVVNISRRNDGKNIVTSVTGDHDNDDGDDKNMDNSFDDRKQNIQVKI